MLLYWADMQSNTMDLQLLSYSVHSDTEFEVV